MTKTCAVCGKKVVFGNTISHAHNVSRRKFYPNLHKVKVRMDGEVKKVYVCSKCLKKGKVERAF